MIHELRTYTLMPGKQGEYLKLNGEIGRKIRGDKYGKLEGYWSTEFGTLNQLVHLWSYEDLGERERLRTALGKDEAWTKEYIPKIRPMMLAQENKILSAVVPMTPPSDAGNVYELRWYRAHVGKLGEWLALGWLTPAMDGLFADSAGARRRYMDRLALALDPAHARHASRYEAALRERNRLLSGEADPDTQWLASIEAQLAEAGAALAQGRQALVERLSAALAGLPDGPFAQPVLAYVPGGPLTSEALAIELGRQRARDRAAQRTLTGPHRDELEVTLAATGAPAARCSTGEQKALLIAITLVHAGLATAGRPGVLLLDEVAAHLDPVRRANLFERLRGSGAQVWLTGTELAPFAGIEHEAAVWRVTGGAVERL